MVGSLGRKSYCAAEKREKWACYSRRIIEPKRHLLNKWIFKNAVQNQSTEKMVPLCNILLKNTFFYTTIFHNLKYGLPAFAFEIHIYYY